MMLHPSYPLLSILFSFNCHVFSCIGGFQIQMEESVLLFNVVLMAAAMLVAHVCVQMDQYPCCCCQDRITRGSDPLDSGRIYEELSG